MSTPTKCELKMEPSYLQQFHVGRGLVFIPDLIIDGIATAVVNPTQFDSKEEALAEANRIIDSYRNKCTLEKPEAAKPPLPSDANNKAARASLVEKFKAVEDFDSLSEDEYGNFIDSLSLEEFIELAKMCDMSDKTN
ncbi:hypothetical protein [Vibrio cholerae]|uniref:hypothetical protein n=1 Tax=Vibrio cholerae TaxID=666 RepID=UPI000E65B117|nr:hypothetical protein [Vibrio cholerae]